MLVFCIVWGPNFWFEKRGLKIFELSPNAIDLTLCQLTVGEAEHNQAEDTGFSEQGDVAIIHYHKQQNYNDKFLFWHGKLYFILEAVKVYVKTRP